LGILKREREIPLLQYVSEEIKIMSKNKGTMIDDADTTSGTRESGGGNGDRDEILEILKLSQKETFRILLWRVVVTGVLAATAFTVTFSTYRLLVREQHESFKNGVSHNRHALIT
jgi:hypothetical protein